MAHILIVGAMQQEVEKIQNWMNGTPKSTKRATPLPYWIATHGSHTLYLVQCGIGKVAAGVSVSSLLDLFPIDFILNTGSAGGLQANQSIGDLVFASATAYHDVNVTGFGYALGQIPQMPAQFPSDQNLLVKAQIAAEELGLPFHTGLILSGDSFVHTKEQTTALMNHFPLAICVEMEAAAIAQVAYLYHVPYLVTRALSDKADSQASLDFEAFLEKASESSSQLIKKIVHSL